MWPKGNYCKATVRETGGHFVGGIHSHNHPMDVGASMAAKITCSVKRKALDDTFKPASAIMEEVLLDEMNSEPVLSKPLHMARAANRLCQQLRPEDPKDLNFKLRDDCLPTDFLQADIRVKNRRHLVFATHQQLEQLSKAKSWYVDGTFKLVRHPFTQLLTINAFVRAGEYAKQVPLAFVLMSGRKANDYKKVLRKIINVLPSAPSVSRVFVDFEKALWSAFKSVLLEAVIMGCVFHWTQVLWRKVQDLGMAAAYSRDDGTYRYIKQLMALPFLPAQEINPAFQRLRLRATTDALNKLFQYISETRISSMVFPPPENWSVYGQAIRTNNDVEGWHNGLNR